MGSNEEYSADHHGQVIFDSQNPQKSLGVLRNPQELNPQEF